jgi:hypothetical protein
MGKRSFVVALLLGSTVLAACGGGKATPSTSGGGSTSGPAPSPTASASGSTNTANLTACGVITQADVQDVLGTSVEPGDGSEGPSAHITLCMYSAAGVLIRLSPEIGAQEHAAFPFDNPKPVAGLGDEALFAKTETGTALSVLKGTVEISIFYSGEGDALEISKALAEKGLAKL